MRAHWLRLGFCSLVVDTGNLKSDTDFSVLNNAIIFPTHLLLLLEGTSLFKHFPYEFKTECFRCKINARVPSTVVYSKD